MPLPPGLVAFWRGETDASDLIGGPYGTFFAGASATAPSVTTDGKVGAAFNFDGTVHVRVPDSAALKLGRMTARYFETDGGLKGLLDERYERLARLSETIEGTKAFRGLVSTEWVEGQDRRLDANQAGGRLVPGPHRLPR